MVKRLVCSLIAAVMFLMQFPVSLTVAANGSYTVAEIAEAASKVVETTEKDKSVPDKTVIAGDVLDTGLFYKLIMYSVVALDEGKDISESIIVEECYAAPNSNEKIDTERLSRAEYVEIAKKAIEFVNKNGRAANYITTPDGRMGYENAIYVFSRILDSYNKNSKLPDEITYISWDSFTGTSSTQTPAVNTPVPTQKAEKYFSVKDVVAASVSLSNSILINREVPDSISVADDELTISQYVNVALRAVVNINNGSTDDVPFYECAKAPSPLNADSGGSFSKENYIEVAENGINFINNNKRLPNYMTASFGQMGIESVVYAYSRILASYSKNGVLPESINVIAWQVFIMLEDYAAEQENGMTTFNHAQIRIAAQRVLVAVEKENKLPKSMTLGSTKIYMPNLLGLFCDAVIGVENGVYADFTVQNVLSPIQGVEKMSVGSLTKNEYLVLASDIKQYIRINPIAPESMPCKLGSVSFENLVYTYANIIINGGESIQLRPWSSITGEKLPEPMITELYTPVPEMSPSNSIKSSQNIKKVSQQSIITAAKRLLSVIKYQKQLPIYVNVGTEVLTAPEFLMLLMRTVLYVNGNLYTAVEITDADMPEGDGENIKNGASLSKSEIIRIAKEAVAYTDVLGFAPSYMMTEKGEMGFKTALSFFAKMVAEFEKEYVIPDSMSVETWESITGMVLPTPMITIAITPTPIPTPYNGVGVMEGDLYGTGGVGTSGAVASSSKYASKIGIDILKAGGNAVDAAVATIFAVGLCEPSGSSLGGGGITVIYLADEDKYITMDYMVGGTGSGPAGIPGIPLGAVTMLENYGTMELEEILAPVIKLAREGFAVTNTFCKKSTLVGDKEGTYLHSLFRNNGEYFREGDIFKNEDLANMLQAISDNGIEYFYDSEFTDELCEYMQSKGCTMTREDFAAYEVFEDVPRVGEYRGYTIYTGSGTATGGASVLDMLDKMEQYDISLLGHDHAETVRITAAAFGIRPSSSLNEKTLFSFDELTQDIDWFDTKSTTMLVTYDKYGNMVSSNNTLGANFGSEIAMPGTGFCMSSRNCSVGGRVSSTMSPSIVAHNDGTPMLGVGSPGNSAIITATAITISNVIDFDMNVIEAIHAPRLYGSGSTITIEARYSDHVKAELSDMGFVLYAKDDFSDGVGCVSAIYVDEDGTIYSGADIRREYMSYAY